MSEKTKKGYEAEETADGIHSIQKVIEPPRESSRPIIKYLLIGVSVLFLAVMLVIPLIVVAVNAFRDGWPRTGKPCWMNIP